MANEWIVEKERTVVDSPFMSVIERDCRSSEDSRPHRFYILKSRDWCNIIPITESGNIVLVRQFRIGLGRHTLEIPGGVVDLEDGDPSVTAVRELEEETGYVPLPGVKVVSLGWNHPNPAIQNNRCFSYAIGPVRKQREQKLDYGEMIEIVERPLTDVPRIIENGEITHALMLNTFFRLGLQSKSGVSALLETLGTYRHGPGGNQ
jgi:ADP-ribose pyrophosphatase